MLKPFSRYAFQKLSTSMWGKIIRLEIIFHPLWQEPLEIQFQPLLLESIGSLLQSVLVYLRSDTDLATGAEMYKTLDENMWKLTEPVSSLHFTSFTNTPHFHNQLSHHLYNFS